MTVKIKGMSIPENCESCPLIMREERGYRKCSVLDEALPSFLMEYKSSNCPIEEAED